MAKKTNKKSSPFLQREDGLPSAQERFIRIGLGKDYVNDALFWGTRAAGKTHALLLDFFITVAYYENHNIDGILFRRSYKALATPFKHAKKIADMLFGECNKNGYKAFGGKGNTEIKIYRDGKVRATLYFRALSTVKEYEDNYHGHEYQWIGFDEITTWHNMELFNLMSSCLRYSDPNGNTEELPLKMRCSSNPWGIGLNSVMNHYLKDKDGRDLKEGELQVNKIYLNNEDYITNKKMAIFGSWVENEYLTKDYPLTLIDSANGDQGKIDAFVYGIPNFNESGMFSDLMIDSKVIVDPFNIPKEWAKTAYISYDDGTTSPFSVLWTVRATTNHYINAKGIKVFIPKDSMFVLDEIYGNDAYFNNISDNMLENDTKFDLSVGVKFEHSKIADLIKERNDTYIRLLLGGRVANCGPADNSISKNDRGGVGNTVYDIFKRKGLNWDKSYKASGSRVEGANTIRNMLQATINNDAVEPHLYFFRNRTRFLVKNLKDLRRDPSNPDDIFDENRDHDYDALRYAISYKRKQNGGRLFSY